MENQGASPKEFGFDLCQKISLMANLTHQLDVENKVLTRECERLRVQKSALESRLEDLERNQNL